MLRTLLQWTLLFPAGFILAQSCLLGAERDRIISAGWTESRLASVLVPLDRYRPFPKAGDPAWSLIPEEIRRSTIEAAEGIARTEWPVLKATLFLDYARTGTRAHYERLCFDRRGRLADLVAAEAIEGKGRFLDPIADGIWLICEESYWGVPAHIGMQRAGVGLPDVEEPTVDLFAAETGALLSWTWYLLGDRLDDVSPLIGKRIAHEVDRRILTPNLERDDFWWLGFQRRPVNNWNPWINSNWLTAVLLLEQSESRRVKAVVKVMRSLDRFLADYPEDGGCDEGPSYWGRAGASLFDCLELLKTGTDGAASFFEHPLVREIGRYIYRVHIGRDWFVSFADASAKAGTEPALVYRFGKAIGDQDMQRFGAFLAAQGRSGSKASSVRGGDLGRRIPALFAAQEMSTFEPFAPLPRDVWLPGLQVMVAREQGGSEAGFFLAAKGGHNAESHNHNDVGNFVVFFGADPVIIDVGVGTYTAKTFSDDRYSIWTMQSAFHNLPTFDGLMQAPGKEFAAREISHQAGDDVARFELELSGAYPSIPADSRTISDGPQLLKLHRTLLLERAGRVSMTDSFETANEGPAAWTFMTACEPRLAGPGRIRLETASGVELELRFPAAVLRPEVEVRDLEDPRLVSSWGNRIWRLLLRTIKNMRQGEVRVELLEAGS